MQATAEDRAEVTNIIVTKMNLITQVAEYSNLVATKDAAMVKMQNIIRQL